MGLRARLLPPHRPAKMSTVFEQTRVIIQLSLSERSTHLKHFVFNQTKYHKTAVTEPRFGALRMRCEPFKWIRHSDGLRKEETESERERQREKEKYRRLFKTTSSNSMDNRQWKFIHNWEKWAKIVHVSASTLHMIDAIWRFPNHISSRKWPNSYSFKRGN